MLGLVVVSYFLAPFPGGLQPTGQPLRLRTRRELHRLQRSNIQNICRRLQVFPTFLFTWGCVCNPFFDGAEDCMASFIHSRLQSVGLRDGKFELLPRSSSRTPPWPAFSFFRDCQFAARRESVNPFNPKDALSNETAYTIMFFACSKDRSKPLNPCLK